MARNEHGVVVSKETKYGTNSKTGKRIKHGTKITYADGTKQTLLNPAGKVAKAYKELRDGKRYLNNGHVKIDRQTNQEMPLSDTQKAWRSGYLQAQKDSSNAYKSK